MLTFLASILGFAYFLQAGIDASAAEQVADLAVDLTALTTWVWLLVKATRAWVPNGARVLDGERVWAVVLVYSVLLAWLVAEGGDFSRDVVIFGFIVAAGAIGGDQVQRRMQSSVEKQIKPHNSAQ